MSINRILVTKIRSDYSAELIAKMFWYQGIAKVSTITLTPDLLYQIADITIASWCDTEAAYEFIKKLVYQDKIMHGDWVVQDNSAVETSCFSSAFYEVLCEDKSDSWSDDEQEETMEEAIDREMRAEALEAGEILEDEEKPVIRVYQGCEKYTIPEAKCALEVLYHYQECGYCGMTPVQIAVTIESVEAQLSLYGVETKTIREPIAPALPEISAAERVILEFRFGGKLTVDEAIDRWEELNNAIDNNNSPDALKEVIEVMEYCEELDYLEEQLRKYGNKRLASEERVIQYFGIPEQYMTVKEANKRLDFLKTASASCTSGGEYERMIVRDIQAEIEFLEDQLFSIVTLKSQNVTLRPHQQSFVV